MSMTSYCEVCGKPFKKNHPRQIVCGNKECRKEHAKRNRDRLMEERRKTAPIEKCIICGREFRKIWPNTRTCGSGECRGELSRRTRSKSDKPGKIRPYSWDTDMLIIIDMLKGWDDKKVAKVNARALGRDYKDVLRHVEKLKGSDREREILKILGQHGYS